MIKYEVVSRYSNALIGLGTKRGKLKPWMSDLRQASELINANPKLYRFLNSPLINDDAKRNVLDKCFKEKIDPELINFIALLIHHKRLSSLTGIVKEYSKKVGIQLESLKVYLIVTHPLEEETKNKLKNKIEKSYHKKIEFKEKIAPEILGGLIVIIGNRMLDFSIKGRLQKLRESLFVA